MLIEHHTLTQLLKVIVSKYEFSGPTHPQSHWSSPAQHEIIKEKSLTDVGRLSELKRRIWTLKFLQCKSSIAEVMFCCVEHSKVKVIATQLAIMYVHYTMYKHTRTKFHSQMSQSMMILEVWYSILSEFKDKEWTPWSAFQANRKNRKKSWS